MGLGLVSEGVYLGVTLRLPWWRYGDRLSSWRQLLGEGGGELALCLVGIGVLMAAYAWGWRLVRQGAGRRWMVWAFAGLFALTLFWLTPITSDLFGYLGQAHLLTDLGANPLAVAPLSVGDDPLLGTYPVGYGATPSVYGPAWLLVSAPGTLGHSDAVDGFVYLKVLAAVAYLGSAWLLERILRATRQQAGAQAALEGVYLFAWNPLVLLMAVGDGHNDAVMVLALLLAFWALLRARWVLAFGALALSSWVKYVGLVFVPLFGIYALRAVDDDTTLEQRGGLGWERRRLGPVAGLVAAGGVTVAAFLPFWAPELVPGNGRGGAEGFPTVALWLGMVLFAVAYGALAWRLLRGPGTFQHLANVSFVVALLAFVLGAARSQPWHLLWPAALAGLSDRRWAWPVVMVLSGVMLVGQVWVEWGVPGAEGLW
jgi:hypothetical protein